MSGAVHSASEASEASGSPGSSGTTGVSGSDAEQVHAAALAGLGGMTPVRLAKLLDGFSPITAWAAVRAGTHPADPRRKFATEAGRTEVDRVGERYDDAGVSILLPSSPRYPAPLLGDPGAPAVLFASGDPAVLEDRRRVAIVGTRSASPYGRQVASGLARDLAAEGVVVVSGLARGIDGAAHSGVVRCRADQVAPPVAVVGTGLDTIYPASNRALWETVVELGVVFSEASLGTHPHPGVFPARNRIIAALSHVVVVVESHLGGGSLYTAEAAARRGIPVCAVPGSVLSRSSHGTNALLVDGCTPVRDATDVMVAIDMATIGSSQASDGESRSWSNPERDHRRPGGRDGQHRGSRGREVPPVGTTIARLSVTEEQRAVVEAVDDTPTTFESILLRTGLSIASAAKACDELTEAGHLEAGAGWWSRR